MTDNPLPDRPARLRQLVSRVRVDLTPLRSSRDFRLLIGGGAVSMFGSYITFIAVPFQVKEITGSYLAVGLIGAAELILLVGFGLWGGALADAVDRAGWCSAPRPECACSSGSSWSTLCCRIRSCGLSIW
ncbi:MAG: MFS transporter [Sporichthyaceae bacterium]|nr:MFS transporter [Sporichthyaceae bacterium]